MRPFSKSPFFFSDLDDVLKEVFSHLLQVGAFLVLNTHDDRVSSLGNAATFLIFDILKGHLHNRIRSIYTGAAIVCICSSIHVNH